MGADVIQIVFILVAQFVGKCRSWLGDKVSTFVFAVFLLTICLFY